jgi:type I restriction enzyme R subunit
LIIYNAYGDIITEEEKDALKPLIKKLIVLLRDAIDKPNFWKDRDTEIRKLEGQVSDLLDFSGIPVIESLYESLTLELMTLAKKRHNDLTGE